MTNNEFIAGQIELDDETKFLPNYKVASKVILKLVSGSVSVDGFALGKIEIPIDQSGKIKLIGTGTVAYLIT